jgi:hypothetical protein
MEPTPPSRPGRKRHRALRGRLSGWGWGGQIGESAAFSVVATYWSSWPLYSPVSVLRKATIWSRSASVYGVVNW